VAATMVTNAPQRFASLNVATGFAPPKRIASTVRAIVAVAVATGTVRPSSGRTAVIVQTTVAAGPTMSAPQNLVFRPAFPIPAAIVNVSQVLVKVAPPALPIVVANQARAVKAAVHWPFARGNVIMASAPTMRPAAPAQKIVAVKSTMNA
jgi:hypothetical protein